MDLYKFANVNSSLKDLDTGQEIKWKDYMARIINKIGLERIKPYIPYDTDLIKEKLKEDVHLNNLPLCEWDRASGFNLNVRFDRGKVLFYHTGLGQFLIHNGINAFSLSECVCILKEAARMLCEKET